MSEYHLIYFTPRQYLHFSYVCIRVLHLVYFFISPVKICLFFVTHRHDNDTATTHTHRFLSVSVYSTKISILLYDSLDVSTRLQFQSKAQNGIFLWWSYAIWKDKRPKVPRRYLWFPYLPVAKTPLWMCSIYFHLLECRKQHTFILSGLSNCSDLKETQSVWYWLNSLFLKIKVILWFTHVQTWGDNWTMNFENWHWLPLFKLTKW